jgi:hypothetical protein
MKTIQFEGVKVALKQDKTGYVLALSMHPDDIPEDLLRDFVGARYQVVMVRIGADESPLNREEFIGDKTVRIAGLLCRDPKFWKYLYDGGQIFEEEEGMAADWLRHRLNIKSRSELKTREIAKSEFYIILEEFNKWNKKS